MTIQISNMHAHPGAPLVEFDATFPGGWVIHDCVLIQQANGNLAALPPLLRANRRAVTIAPQFWFAFISAAAEAYEEFASSDDSGLRRVLGAAETESLALAGI